MWIRYLTRQSWCPIRLGAELNLGRLAMRAERKVIDKIVDGLKFHS